MSGFPDSALWDFATALYAGPGVPAACLSLQARRGADVNLLLFALWLGASGRGALDAALLARAAAAAGPWHDAVVRGLRRVRDALRQEALGAATELAARLRKAVLAAELDAEHIEELMLESLAPPARPDATPDSRLRDAVRNARAYLATLPAPAAQDKDGSDKDEDTADLRVLLGGIFPALDGARLDAALA